MDQEERWSYPFGNPITHTVLSADTHSTALPISFPLLNVGGFRAKREYSVRVCVCFGVFLMWLPGYQMSVDYFER